MNGTLPRRVTPTKLKARRYAHFDDQLDQAQLDSFTISPRDVARHAFMPLLGYQKRSRSIDFSVFPPLAKDKEREIRYAAHKDAAIFSLYARTLSPQYDAHLKVNDLDAAVLAYRGGIGYNVPFAKSLFDEIKGQTSCTVICLDISGFFDNLRHDHLKLRMQEVLGTKQLQDDWYRIFLRLTRFEFALREDVEKAVGKIHGTRICSIMQFRKLVRPIIKRNPNDYGIPQGTSLSGLLANIYMLGFDATIQALVKSEADHTDATATTSQSSCRPVLITKSYK